MDEDQVSVRVIQSPVASAGPDQTVCSDSEVTFDGSGSIDIDGVVNRFLWDFGDGETGAGERAKHVFTVPGEYVVSLTIEGDVVGECSNTDSDEMTVTVVEAPQADIRVEPEVAVGSTVTFDGSGSASPASAIQSWKWDFGDGTTADGERVEHIYDTPGEYVIRLEIDTADGDMVCSSVVDYASIRVNEQPTARAEGPALVGVNEVAVFTGSLSNDPDGTVTSYYWDFGDGSSDDGIRVEHQFEVPGPYDVVLVAVDETSAPNNEASDTLRVAVNHAPEIELSVPEHVCVAEEVVFDASESQDADGDSLAFTWTFGEGSEAAGPRATHTYREPGRHGVTVAVDDGTATSNGRQEAARTVHVNHPPFAAAGPDRVVCPGDEVSFDGTLSYDIDRSPLSYEWSFGDSAVSSDSVTSHTYVEPGLYSASLSVLDPTATSCGRQSDSAEILVNGAPTIRVDGDREVYFGGAYDAAVFDASETTDPEGHALSFVWDFGDGSGGTGARVSHAYVQPGEYTVVVEASDETGLACGVSSSEFTVTVRERP
jgi:PKD repeat protein